MNKISILALLCLLIIMGCSEEEIYIKKEKANTQEDKKSLQIVTDFLHFDQTTYDKLLKDEDFLLLCDTYDYLRQNILFDTTFLVEQKNHLSDSIFSITKTLSKKYDCENLFNYTLHKVNNKTFSRAHDWGQCYFHPDGYYVCDTYENWQKAWRECASYEGTADLSLQFKLDVFKYRTALLAYILNLCNSCAHVYRNFASITNARVGDYTFAETSSLQSVIHAYESTQIESIKICYEIKNLESHFTDFFYSRVWTKCILGGETSPSPTNPYDSIWQGGGGGIIPEDGKLYATIQGPSKTELMKKYNILATVKCTDSEKRIPRIASVTFDIKDRTKSGTWKTLDDPVTIIGGNAVLKRLAIAPGFWDIQATITLEGETGEIVTCNTLTVEEYYPDISKFQNLPVVTSRAVDLWNKVVAFATSNQSTRVIREYGCLIYIDTRTGDYYCGPDILGDTVTLDRAVEAIVKYNYDEILIDPREHRAYAVGTLHSHYPLTWAVPGSRRPAGPSSRDLNVKLPGLVYDYTQDVLAGDPIDIPGNPKKIYSFGPTRRDTYKW